MWAVIPPLPSQPVVDLVPDQPSRVIQYGWPSDFGQILGQYRISVFPYIGQTITLASAIPHIHAVHFMLRHDPFSDFSVCLGPRYRFTLKSHVNSDPIDPCLPFNPFQSNRYLRATIEDNGSAVTTANLPNIPYPNRFVYPTSSGLVVCFGYVFDGPQLKAYAHVSSHRVTPNASLQVGVVPSCGSGTASMIANVDAGDALAGGMSLVVREPSDVVSGDVSGWGAIEFFSMACRLGPFSSASHHLQEIWTTKLARAGTRVASLRSSATNFSQPMATGGNLISAANKNNQGVADIDCGGHAEFSQSSRFAISLAGQPDADTAYIAAGGNARGNCGFTVEQLQRMSRVRVVGSVDLDPSPFFSDPVSFSADADSNAYGNNEYAVSVANNSSASWDTIHVQVKISGYENVANFSEPQIQNVSVNFALRVTWSIFASLGGQRVNRFYPTGGENPAFGPEKILNESEAEAFFNGGSITLLDGTAITAIG